MVCGNIMLLGHLRPLNVDGCVFLVLHINGYRSKSIIARELYFAPF